jgi:hypothetical protein
MLDLQREGLAARIDKEGQHRRSVVENLTVCLFDVVAQGCRRNCVHARLPSQQSCRRRSQ